LADRETVVLNFAKEGYRTSQNLNTLIYFLLSDQKFDLILNIGGYNEITGPWENYQQGANPAFPTTSLLYALSTLTEADRISRETVKLYQGQYMRADAASCTLEIFWASFHTYGKHLTTKIELEKTSASAYKQNQNVLIIPVGTEIVSQVPFKTLFSKLWSRSVRLMHALSTALGAECLHIIQPS
jgi:hypothetical protein